MKVLERLDRFIFRENFGKIRYQLEYFSQYLISGNFEKYFRLTTDENQTRSAFPIHEIPGFFFRYQKKCKRKYSLIKRLSQAKNKVTLYERLSHFRFFIIIYGPMV